MYYKLIVLLSIICVNFECYGDSIGGPNLKLSDGKNAIKVPPCKLCKILTDSFQKV